MNLYSSSRASSLIDWTSARAAAGSRNSSTNFMASPGRSSEDGAGRERGQFVGVALAHLLDGLEGQVGLVLIDLRHCETDVDEYPVGGLQALLREQADADGALDP